MACEDWGRKLLSVDLMKDGFCCSMPLIKRRGENLETDRGTKQQVQANEDLMLLKGRSVKHQLTIYETPLILAISTHITKLKCVYNYQVFKYKTG